jgi:phytoene dehydrogenase-like protein
MTAFDVIFVGGGHNGLVAATRLARAGLKTLVLECRSTTGGAAITEELHSGYRCSTLAHSAQPDAAVLTELRLAEQGLEMIDPDPYLIAPLSDGRRLVLSRDDGATIASIRQFSERDANRYAEFKAVMTRVTSFVSSIMATSPPEIEHSTRRDLWTLLGMARRLRGLGKQDAYRLLRWAPMSAADFVSEWFESEPLRAVLAARGVFGTAFGPRSAGSAAVLLMQMAAGGGIPRLVRGGLGAFNSALASAALASGVTLRTEAEVSRIDVRSGRVAGVTLMSGEELPVKTVVSNADPRRTLLGLVDPVELEPGFLTRIRSYRCAGTVAKINLALGGLPRFNALALSDDGRTLAGCIHIAPNLDYLERAFDASKYGTFSPRPYLDVTIPSISDPTLAPRGAHVMSINAQFAPYCLRGTDWTTAAPLLADTVVDTLDEYAPGLGGLIVHRQVITPIELESTYGLSGGHIFHGELAMDQLFTMRPLLGWAQYRTPIGGLYLCGAGTHPGYGVSGLSGLNASNQILKDLRRR